MLICMSASIIKDKSKIIYFTSNKEHLSTKNKKDFPVKNIKNLLKKVVLFFNIKEFE